MACENTLLTKIDSNVTGLRLAEEECYKTLPATPVWYPREPNSYGDFGGSIVTTPRNPINPSRQKKKGTTTDLEAGAAWEEDVTLKNMQNPLQGFFFADLRRKNDVGLRESPEGQGTLGVDDDFLIVDIDTTADEITVDSRVAVSAAVVAGGTGYTTGDIIQVTDANASVNARFTVTASGGVVSALTLLIAGRTHTDTGAGAATTAITGSGNDDLTVTVTYGNGLTWLAGDILFLSGNNDIANDGLKVVSSVSDNVITTVENLTTDASPAATAKMTTVGHQFAADDLNVVTTSGYPTITSDASFDFTTLGLIPGEWIFVGGDTAATQFSTAANNGFARVRAISATALTLDKSQATMVDESLSGGETVQIFMGRVLKNETGSLIKRRTYTAERTLGAPDPAAPSEVQAEYVRGCVPNEFSLAVPSADKVMANLSYVGAETDTVDAATALATGTRPALEEADALNTSSDFSRIKMAVHSLTDSAPTALFAFVQEINLTINNNATGNKAVGQLGNFEVTVGTFEVSGDITAYFADVAALDAVRNNSNVSLDIHMVKSNAGISLDLPLFSLGDGRPNVAQDEAITLPLNVDAATAALIDTNLDHTLLAVFWDYLPDAADV
jgi:hypothetical protein